MAVRTDSKACADMKKEKKAVDTTRRDAASQQHITEMHVKAETNNCVGATKPQHRGAFRRHFFRRLIQQARTPLLVKVLTSNHAKRGRSANVHAMKQIRIAGLSCTTGLSAYWKNGGATTTTTTANTQGRQHACEVSE